MIQNSCDNILIVNLVFRLSKIFFESFPSLKHIFLEFVFQIEDDLDLTKINECSSIRNRMGFLKGERKITVRYTLNDKNSKKCKEYCDIVLGSDNTSSRMFSLFLCRYSKTSCLRKLHKYVFQCIMKFLTNHTSYIVDNSPYKFYYPKHKDEK